MDNNELLQAISAMLDTKLDAKLQPIETRLDRLETKVDNLETKVDNLETNVSNLQSEVTALQRDTAMLKEDTRHIIKKQDFMFDEMERIHEILLDHKNDTNKHIA